MFHRITSFVGHQQSFKSKFSTVTATRKLNRRRNVIVAAGLASFMGGAFWYSTRIIASVDVDFKSPEIKTIQREYDTAREINKRTKSPEFSEEQDLKVLQESLTILAAHEEKTKKK